MKLKSHWLEKYPRKDSLVIIGTLFRHEAEQAGPFSDELIYLFDAQDWEGLLSFEVDYTADVNSIIHARQALGFLTKFEPLGALIKRDRKGEALEKFLESERVCRETNDIFRKWAAGKMNFLPALSRQLFLAQRKVRSIMGKCPKFSDLEPKLGPGATTTLKRRKAVPSYKLVPPFACAPATVPYLESIFRCNPALLDVLEYQGPEGWGTDVLIHDGRLEFVPKNALSFRSICIPPILTSMYQLAIGDVLQPRMRKYGLDVRDQTRNQRLAREGSITGLLATMDLVSASDLNATELIRFMADEDWFSLLSGFRDTWVSYDTRDSNILIPLEKFSTMGNGYTFPLETIIFYALAWAASEDRRNVTAYGDDIICASSDFSSVATLLQAVGHKPNLKKSFAEGPFRESCGKDYVSGINVRPFYFKELISNQSLFVLHNFYVRNYDEEAAALVLALIHPTLRIYGPDGYGDGHLLGDWTGKRHKRKSGYCGRTFETFSVISRRSHRVLPGDWVATLYTIYVGENREQPLSRDYSLVKTFAGGSKYKRTRIYALI